MIGVFDSGFGGLSILKDLRRVLPEYDFVYLGVHLMARALSKRFSAIRSRRSANSLAAVAPS